MKLNRLNAILRHRKVNFLSSHEFPRVPMSSLLLFALVSMAFFASAAEGQDQLTPTATIPAFGPTAVQPNVVSTSPPVELVVVGHDFADGAVVILDNSGALPTTFVSDSLLRADLPAAVPAGTYNITV